MSVSAVRMRVNMAKESLESGRLDLVEQNLVDAARFLAGLTADEAAPWTTEIADLQARVAAMPTEEETRFVGAAIRELKQARSRIEERQLSGVEDIIKRAANYVVNVRPAHRARVDAEIAAVTAELAAASPAVEAPRPVAAPPPTPVAAPAPTVVATPAPAPPPPAVAAPAPTTERRQLTDAEYSEQSRLRGSIRSVFSRVETRRTEGALEELATIEPQLATLPDFATEQMRAQIVEIRTMYQQIVGGEAGRIASSELNRHLNRADGSIETMSWHHTRESLAHVERRLDEADVKSALSADEIAGYRKRAADIRQRLAAFIKQDAIERTRDVILELEREVTKAFAGVAEHEIYKRKNDLDRLRMRVLSGLRHADETDPDIAAIAKRVALTDDVVEKALLAVAKKQLDAAVSNDWSVIEQDIAGWDAEQDTQSLEGLYEPSLPKTRMAIQRTRWLLDAPDTKERRAAHPSDPAIQLPYQTAERTLADAGAKLAEAYSRVLAHAESLPTPLSQFTLVRPNLLAYSAEADLAGTPAREAVVGRARALDERWKAEVAAIYKLRQDLYDKLDAESDTAWPVMRDATEAQPFDRETARVGSVVLLEQVYNRCGWDFGSRAYSFAVQLGDAVLGGSYEPHVLAALEHAWYHLKLSVNDRIPWDVIGVVEGPDKIGVRTTVTLRDKSSGAKIGELEEWPPIDCLRIRIVALRAGPVAVTPRSPWAPSA